MPFINEYDTNKPPWTLVLTYTVGVVRRIAVPAGAGGTARAIEDLVRSMAGCVNVDPESVRFSVEDPNGTPC